jgi:ABC-type Mn2+/Zn2+ transport system permease subunit
MLDWLLEPFRSGIDQRALVEVLALSLACGPLGVWVLLYRRSYAAESLSHGMLPGLVLAALAGAPLVIGALGGVVACAGAMALAGRDERLGPDVSVGLAVTVMFGLGAMLALSPEAPPRLQELLFGDLLGVSDTDLVVGAALAVAVAVALAGGFRTLALGAFDPGAARSLGTTPARADRKVQGLLALTTVAAVEGLGNLLAIALILAPGAAALNLTRRLGAACAVACLLGAAAGALGIVASYRLSIAAGASVAACALAIFAVSLAAPRRRRPPASAPGG